MQASSNKLAVSMPSDLRERRGEGSPGSHVSDFSSTGNVRGLCKMHTGLLQKQLEGDAAIGIVPAACAIAETPWNALEILGGPQCLTTALLDWEPLTPNWLRGLPALQFQRVPSSRPNALYVCPLSQQVGEDRRSYLLVCTAVAIAPAQQSAIEQQAALLSHSLVLHQRLHQQQAQIEQLQSQLHQTGHQLGNSVALVELYADLLVAELPQGPWHAKAELIGETVADMNETLAQLTRCDRVAPLQQQRADLHDILEDSHRSLLPWLTNKNLTVEWPEVSVTLFVDRWQMKQVFDNLLSNAMHFSPVGERIICDWQVFRNEVVISVRDRGPGLSEADLQQIFTPFYSRRPGGTGLGLAIARKIVMDRGGTLWAENLPEGGTQFSFTLPRT